jgi:hypothetical protein
VLKEGVIKYLFTPHCPCPNTLPLLRTEAKARWHFSFMWKHTQQSELPTMTILRTSPVINSANFAC